MNKNIKTCPNCDAYEVKGEYHSLFGCGSYYSDMRMGTPTIIEKREGYKFHETLQCAHNRIATLNIRLRKVEEYVKKQTEVPEVPKQTLKSLEEHNNKAYNTFAAVNNLNSGFACQSVEKNCIIIILIRCWQHILLNEVCSVTSAIIQIMYTNYE